ncbi:MAG: hypothetical protein M5R36_16920 [Deltaproteobacteria bacterium]|nr:hypothetical protein [Deltaproteobacteria bacterium]
MDGDDDTADDDSDDDTADDDSDDDSSDDDIDPGIDDDSDLSGRSRPSTTEDDGQCGCGS